MKRLIKVLTLFITAVYISNIYASAATVEIASGAGFEMIEEKYLEDFSSNAYRFRHSKTGAELIYVDDGSDTAQFSIGFKTPPLNSRGGNHVLEHSLLCGSGKYPTKNLMYYLRNASAAEEINAYTVDDFTYYSIKTKNQTEYYNLIDAYMNGLFDPMLLSDENIFRQQGIRLEYVNGEIAYNGVVYNELKLKSLESADSSIDFLNGKLYGELYGNTTPSFIAGGTVDAIKDLSYSETLDIYKKYYNPSNCMVYLSGEQDLEKTLGALDEFFKNYDLMQTNVDFADTKRLPLSETVEYNMDSKTVDIGFLSSGVPMDSDMSEIYAREIVFNIIRNRMSRTGYACYSSGGNAGGIANVALLIAGIPTEDKDKAIADYKNTLEQLSVEGFNEAELRGEIESLIAENKDTSLYPAEQMIFKGYTYAGDPFKFTEISETYNFLINNPDYFSNILKKYFTENPYSITAVSGNDNAPVQDEPPALSAEDIEKIKAETEAFRAWADAPDSEEVIESIPTLTLEEFDRPQENYSPEYENLGGIDLYKTISDEFDPAALAFYFPINIQDDELMYLQTLTSYLSFQAQKRGYDDISFEINGMGDYNDGSKFNRHFYIGLSSSNGDIADKTRDMIEFLKDPGLWSDENFDEYVSSAADNIISGAYSDPYYISYDLMLSSLSPEQRLYASTSGALRQGSIPYYRFLREMESAAAERRSYIDKTAGLLSRLILNSAPIVEYRGSDAEYSSVKNAVIQLFAGKQKQAVSVLSLPMGYDSVAVITNLPDSTHFMLSGKLESGLFSGKLTVLANVVSAKYLEPTLRGKYGAYGSNMSFDRSIGMLCACSGLSDIDAAIEVWKGIPDFLRTLEITQKELDGFIIAAVKEYDEYYNDSAYGAMLALTGKTTKDIEKVRGEMLDVTVEDLRNYADLIDSLISQNRVFAVLGKEGADTADHEFSYYVDSQTLQIAPMLKKDETVYTADPLFASDEYLTRAQVAEMLSKVMVDDRKAENPAVFGDLGGYEEYTGYIEALYEKGLLRGYEDGSFAPGAYLTRAEFAAIIAKFIFGGETDDGSLNLSFTDLTPEHWAYDHIIKTAEAGILNGCDDGSFRPDEPITCSQAASAFLKAASDQKN